jgi:hypothetical protein
MKNEIKREREKQRTSKKVRRRKDGKKQSKLKKED